MSFETLYAIIKQAADDAEYDCRDVIPHNEHSYPCAFNKALAQRLEVAQIPSWLINLLIADPRCMEWNDSIKEEPEFAFKIENIFTKY